MFLKIMKNINKFLKVSITLLLFIITFSLTVQVFFRYVLNTGFVWTDELSRFSLIWIVFLGAVIATHEKSHIKITFLEERLPSLRNVISIIRTVTMAIYALFVGYVGINTLPLVMNQNSANMGISMGIIYSIFIIFSSLTILFVISDLITRLKEKRVGE